MRNKITVFFTICLFICGQSLAQKKIRVAVAANMQYAAEALKMAFEKKEHIAVELIVGSSGKLTQQIMSGAPFDVFISADTEYPQKLAAAKLAAGIPKIYARGLLVLWTLNKNIALNPDLQFLSGTGIKTIAIANPRTAPYGTAAENLLKKYKLYDKLKSKLVFGESITQASQYISTGAVDVGFTAKSIVLSKEMQGRGKWMDVKNTDYEPINQSALLLTYGAKNHPVEAKKFYGFLFAAEAAGIYKSFGYIVK